MVGYFTTLQILNYIKINLGNEWIIVAHRRKADKPKKHKEIKNALDIQATPSALQYARELLKCSMDDIEASKAIHEKGSYALSVYHLQQAVEKAMKAELLINGLYAESDIRQFNHNTYEAFVDQWKTIEGVFQPPGFVSRGTESIIELAEAVKEYPDYNKKLSYGAISRVLDKIDEKKVTFLEKARNQLLPGPEADYLANGHYDVLFGLGFIGLLTYQHESSTRYPEPNGEMKPSDYTEDLGIVKATPELLSRLEYIDAFLEYIAME